MINSYAKSKILNKKIALSISTINKFLFYVFLFNVIFIPNDTFSLKILALLILLIINFSTITNCKARDEKTVVALGFGVTSFTILLSIILTGNIYSNIRMGYPGYILLLYPVVKKNKIDFEHGFIFLLKLLACFIVLMAFLDIIHILDMSKNPILTWLANSSNAMIGKGRHLPIYYMIFMKTSPLMFVALFYCLKKGEHIFSIIIVCAIILSGTRANILMLTMSLVVYFCFLQRNRNARLLCILFVLILGIVLLLNHKVLDFVADMFERKSDSDDVRAGHLRGIFAVWNASPIQFIIGSGFSSEFFSYGRNEMLSNIELSYWNLLRQVGLIPFLLLMMMYIYPICILISKRRNIEMCLGYIVYLIIAYTNPFLYSSTGITLLLFMYWFSFCSRNIENVIQKKQK